MMAYMLRAPSPTHFSRSEVSTLFSRSLQVLTAVAVISDPEFCGNKVYKILYAVFITTSILTAIPVLVLRLCNAWALQRAIQTHGAGSPLREGSLATRAPSMLRFTTSPPTAPRSTRRGSLDEFEFGTRVLLDKYNWELSQIHRSLLSSQLTIVSLAFEDIPMCVCRALC
jgi:hypothetical protein